MCKRSAARSLGALIAAAKFLFHEHSRVGGGRRGCRYQFRHAFLGEEGWVAGERVCVCITRVCVYTRSGLRNAEWRLHLLPPPPPRSTPPQPQLLTLGWAWPWLPRAPRPPSPCPPSCSPSLSPFVVPGSYCLWFPVFEPCSPPSHQVSEGDKPYNDVEVIKTLRSMYMVRVCGVGEWGDGHVGAGLWGCAFGA